MSEVAPSSELAAPETPGVLEIGSETASIAHARHAVAEFLRRHCGWTDGAAVALVLSELLANAVRHANGWWRLRASGDAARLVIEVRDQRREAPRLVVPDLAAASGGLGMHIVTKLSSDLQVEPTSDGGKVVRVVWLRGGNYTL